MLHPHRLPKLEVAVVVRVVLDHAIGYERIENCLQRGNEIISVEWAGRMVLKLDLRLPELRHRHVSAALKDLALKDVTDRLSLRPVHSRIQRRRQWVPLRLLLPNDLREDLDGVFPPGHRLCFVTPVIAELHHATLTELDVIVTVIPGDDYTNIPLERPILHSWIMVRTRVADWLIAPITGILAGDLFHTSSLTTPYPVARTAQSVGIC